MPPQPVLLAVFLSLITLGNAYNRAPNRNDILEGEYLILLKKSAGVTSSRVSLPVQQTLYTGEVGGHGFLHVRATEQQHQLLLHNNLIQTIEPNYIASQIKPVTLEQRPPAESADWYMEPVRVNAQEATDVCTEVEAIEDMWGLIRASHRNLPNYTAESFEYGHTGEGADIYILDSGIDVDHIGFEREDGSRSVASHGFLAAEHQAEGETDIDGHGTFVAGLAGGRFFGVAKEASLVSVKVLGADGTGSYGAIIAGVQYVTARVVAARDAGKKQRAIINMSLSGSSYSMVFEAAVVAAVTEGIIVIAAAGNDAESAAGYFPAAFSHAITVGATDKYDNYADFSNYGDMVDILAPGVQVVGAGSRYAAVCQAAVPGQCYVIGGGTSQAAPHVAGVVARHLGSLSDAEMDAVSQESVRQQLISWSTKCKISYQNSEQEKSPNRLLHDDCDNSEGVSCTPTTTTTTTPTTMTSSTTASTTTTMVPTTTTTFKSTSTSTSTVPATATPISTSARTTAKDPDTNGATISRTSCCWAILVLAIICIF